MGKYSYIPHWYSAFSWLSIHLHLRMHPCSCWSSSFGVLMTPDLSVSFGGFFPISDRDLTLLWASIWLCEVMCQYPCCLSSISDAWLSLLLDLKALMFVFDRLSILHVDRYLHMCLILESEICILICIFVFLTFLLLWLALLCTFSYDFPFTHLLRVLLYVLLWATLHVLLRFILRIYLCECPLFAHDQCFGIYT